MGRFFVFFSSSLIFIGLILFILSFFFTLSVWFGIELVKAGIFLFIISLFATLLLEKEKQPTNEQDIL